MVRVNINPEPVAKDVVAALRLPKQYADVAALLADTITDYFTSASLPSSEVTNAKVVAGSILEATVEGVKYEVAEDDATDHHVATAGGVKLYVLPGDRGYNARAFGAVGDGVATDSPKLKSAFLQGNADGIPVHIPAGNYLCDHTQSADGILLQFSSSSGRLVISGEGAATILKMKDGVHTANFRRLIDIRPSVDMEVVEIGNLVLDTNARGTAPPDVGSYALEQNHSLRLLVNVSYTLNLFSAHNIILKDRVADGISNQGAGTVKVHSCINIHEPPQEQTRTRSTIQFSYLPLTTIISHVTGHQIEMEPITVSDEPRKMYVSNCVLNQVDWGTDSGSDVKFFASNVFADRATNVSRVTLFATNCDFGISITDPRWNFTRKGSLVSNSIIRCKYNEDDGDLASLNVFCNGSGEGMRFRNCDFVIEHDGALPIATSEYMLSNGSAVPAANVPGVVFEVENCRFDARAHGSVNCYRNGTWVLKDNVYACAGSPTETVAAVYYQVGLTPHGSVTTIDGGDFSQCNGNGIGQANSAGNAHNSLTLRGTMTGAAASRITKPASGSLTANDGFTFNTRSILASSLPSQSISGDTLRLNNANIAIGMPTEYMATATSTTAPNWRLTGQKGVKQDTYANRPTGLVASDIGLRFLETNLGPMVYNGTAFIDYTKRLRLPYAYQFGGTGYGYRSRITSGNPTVLSVFLAIKTGVSSTRSVIGEHQSAGNQRSWLVSITSAGKVLLTISGNGSSTYTLTSADSVNDNTWHWIGFVYNGGTSSATLYIDGTAATSTPSGTIPTSLHSTTEGLGVGANNISGTPTSILNANSQIQRVAIYNAALDADDADSIASELFVSDDLLAYFPFQEESGATGYDTTANATHLTLTNIVHSESGPSDYAWGNYFGYRKSGSVIVPGRIGGVVAADGSSFTVLPGELLI